MTAQLLTAIKARLLADPETRFAVSLDRLAYAKDNFKLGTDLVRTFARSADTGYLPENEAAAVAQLRRGLAALTGRTPVLERRYGDLVDSVRDAGGSVFNWVDDREARDVVKLVAGSNRQLIERIATRSAP